MWKQITAGDILYTGGQFPDSYNAGSLFGDPPDARFIKMPVKGQMLHEE